MSSQSVKCVSGSEAAAAAATVSILHWTTFLNKTEGPKGRSRRGISYENKSNHCCLVTASCLSSLRTMGRIRSHLSSNCRDPLFWRRHVRRVEWEEERNSSERGDVREYTKTYIEMQLDREQMLLQLIHVKSFHIN